jgi:geranylgeranyl diphosphate synthase, type II
MLSFKTAQSIIEKEIEILTIPNYPDKLYDPVKYVLANGGKRIRPAMLIMAAELFGSDPKLAIYPALAIEVFHNFTLLHDDLMDNSTVRRNRPTVHIKWDQNTAILSGDVMSIIANKLLLQSSSSRIVKAGLLFNQTAIEVCEGQMLDIEYSKKDNISIPEYLNMIRLKTSVLIAASLGIGAILGNSGDQDLSLIYDFGLNLGMAFQLQDDLLDSFGNEEKFGKKIGNDILTNKKTFLALTAFANASGKDRSDLQSFFSGYDFDPIKKITSVLGIYKKLNVKNFTETEIRKYHEIALDNFNKIDVPEEKKKNLKNLAEMLIAREK